MHRPWRKPTSTSTTTLPLLRYLIFVPILTLPLLLFLLFPFSSPPPTPCDPTVGHWAHAPSPLPLPYDASCPFHRHAWNCLRNAREKAAFIGNSWVWIPTTCGGGAHLRLDPEKFLRRMRGKRIGFVGDSLNENMVVAMLCALRRGDGGARKWKRKGAWRGAVFPKFDVVVGYHRAVLLAKYRWQSMDQQMSANKDGLKGKYLVDVDIPADDWVNITTFYDVLIFNTGHWWGFDKFPKETPLVFYRGGQPITPPLGLLDGLEVVLQSMVHFIEKQVPKNTIKFWRTQSPRHFLGGEWNQNGSCLFKEPLKEGELDSWFHPANNGVNKEARLVNEYILKALQGTDIHLLNITHLSEFRADAHPAIWLGKKDAVAVWGQDCLHWCLPGVPDTWVDILSAQILYHMEIG